MISPMPRTALLCPPTFFDVIDSKNPYMSRETSIDHAKAHLQWEFLRRSLEQSGVKVETIDPVAGLEDMVFAANQVFVGTRSTLGKFIVPSRMRFPSRQREVPHYVAWFRQHGYRVIDLDFGDDYLEGHGDLIWHPDFSRVYAGYGFRTTRGAVEKFAVAMQAMGVPVIPLQLVSEHCYHLDTCFCPLNTESVLIYPGAFSAESLTELRKFWPRVHDLTQDEVAQFMGNGIVAGGNYLTPHCTPHLEQILAQEGLKPLLIDTSEFEKSGGSCFCMKAMIE